ncbi:very short patch repair endonuclease [Bradyrhizobium guangdongense]|uniref:very short patch repair endonuclease n=2 Tax=Bradyrhizobium guangdongense TaxID=1325090 RepID=UPI0016693276|nr:very short patch repair endonuclease [Bradyrhizobium guangdongense]
MVDHLTREQRSRNMSSVRNRNTAPELLARKAAHRLGLRFRLHRSDLPGSPDFVLPKHAVAVFVHGCFWHGHGCCRSKLPQSNVEFWTSKVGKNRVRDRKARRALAKLGWRVVTLWQCELSNADAAEVLVAKKVLGIRLGKASAMRSRRRSAAGLRRKRK